MNAQAPRPDETAPLPLEDELAGPGHGRHGLGRSFRFAWAGLAFALRTQRNLRIHFACLGLVVLVVAALPVQRLEALLLLGAGVAVLLAELINTAVEAAVDVATSTFHPLARVAKDVAAAAVLLASLHAVLVGAIVLADKLWPLRLRAGAAPALAVAAPVALALAWPLLRHRRR